MIRKVVIPALLLLLVALLLVYLNIGLLNQTLPEISGTLRLAELDSTVEVLRTPAGIPKIRAGSTDDLFRALGYIHAQDRLWQMELLRRVASGRVAEILGKEFVETDQFLLRWQLEKLGQQIHDSLTASSQFLLHSYCAGINSFIRTHSKKLPLEFSELKFKPAPWQPNHCLAIWRLYGWLNAGLARQIFLQRLANILDSDYLSFFAMDLPKPIREPAWQRLLNDFSEEFFRQLEIIEKLTGLPRQFDFSQLQSGETDTTLIFAPTGQLTIPNLWYLQQLQTPEFKVWGCAIPGIPLLLSGTNSKIAWSFHPARGRVIRLHFRQAALIEFKEKNVLIPVASADTLIYAFWESEKRVIPGVLEDSAGTQSIFSIDWTGLRPSDEFFFSPEFYQLQNPDSLSTDFKHWGTPLMEIQLADINGNQAAYLSGARWEEQQKRFQRRTDWQFTQSLKSIPFKTERKIFTTDQKMLLDRLLENLVPAEVDPEQAFLIDYLKNWDFTADSASVAATLYNLIVNHLVMNIFSDEMGESLFRDFQRFPDILIFSILKITASENNIWLDDVRTVNHLENLAEMILRSFTQTRKWLAEKNGALLPASTWGNVTRLSISHVLAQNRGRDWWLNSDRIDWRGSGFPENLVFLNAGSEKFYSNAIELRFELTNPLKIHWRMSTGQSGHSYSENYRNQTKNWLERKYLTEIFVSKDEVKINRLLLEPLNQEK